MNFPPHRARLDRDTQRATVGFVTGGDLPSLIDAVHGTPVDRLRITFDIVPLGRLSSGVRGWVGRQMTDLWRLLQFRLVVARVGEMDLARWWNTNSQLGSMGASVLRRGFPRTYRFAQARSVFAVAALRCRELYMPPNAVTLWNLPAALEDDFDQAWAAWIDRTLDWEPFFAELEHCTSDLVHELTRLDLVSLDQLDQLSRLKRSAEQRAVALPGNFTGSADDLALLALGFARGEKNNPAVPYQAWGVGE